MLLLTLKRQVFEIFFNNAKYSLDPVPDLDPKPEPEIFQSLNRNRTAINRYGFTTCLKVRVDSNEKLGGSGGRQ